MEGTQSSRQIRKYWAEYHDFQSPELWVFGPNYSEKELDFRRDTKKKALNFVLDMSNSSLAKLLTALETTEEAARAAYDHDALKNLEGVTFQIMMAEDGCFFLLLAFTIIGIRSAGIELNFPENHSVFGIGCVREKLELWLNSLFFVGNQVPYVVLDELMKLCFFQKLKTEHEWPQPLELAKSALHKFLMTDHQLEAEKPIDLIHCLQLMIILGREYCSESHDSAIPIVLDDEDSGVDRSRKEDIPSASELSELGITFVKLEGEKGSRGILYKRNLFSASLYLPVLKVDRYTKLMIVCLHKYEIVHHRARGIEPEASSYFKVLSDLIRTPQDVEVLAASHSHGHGVIQGQILEGLPELLMCNCVDMVVSQHLLRVRREINKYPPLQWWKTIKLILKIIAIVSAFFTPFYFLLEIQNNINTFYDQVHHH